MSVAETARILLVEDSPTDARLLQQDLSGQRHQKYEITWAERLDDAIMFLRSQVFDVCLLDLSLPDSMGMATLTHVQAAAPDLPVVILTGALSDDEGVNAIRLGAQDYLTKKCADGATVARAIRYAIERKRAEEATLRLNDELGRRVVDIETSNVALVDSQRRALLLMEEAVQARELSEKTAAELLKSESRFRLLSKTASELLFSITPQEDIVMLCCEVMEHLGCSLFLNYMVDRNDHRLHLNAYIGITAEQAHTIEWLDIDPVLESGGPADSAGHRAGSTLAASDPRMAFAQTCGIKVLSNHALLSEGGDVAGTISFGAANRDHFNADELALMRAVTDQAAVAMVRMQSEKSLQRSHEELERRVRARTAELSLSEERFRLALSSGAMMVAQTDTRLRFTWMYNPLLGIDQTRAIGRRPDEVLAGADNTALTTALSAVLAGTQQTFFEVSVYVAGEERVLDVRAETLRSPDGNVTGLTFAAQDITERRRLEAQLLQAQKMEAIGRLAGGIAHDFNNMMQVVTGYARRMLRQLPAGDQMRAGIERIKQAGESATSLTQQLLALGRKQILQMSVIDINELLSNVEPMLRQTLTDNVTLVLRQQPNLHAVKADVVRLEQVILNLTLNARDAMTGGGTLTLETANVSVAEVYPYDTTAVSAGPYVMIAVSDTGCGMDKETLSKAFDPFFTTKAPGQGSGMGLATIFGTVEQIGGVLRVYSTPGTGTTFKIFLPSSTEPMSVPVVSVPRIRAVGGKETLLVVEDNPSVREFTVAELVDAGYDVLQAQHGPEAIAIAERYEGTLSLLVVDVMLPGMNGREISERISALIPGIQTLFMSGYTEASIVDRGVILPGKQFLQKPFSTESLLLKVREILLNSDSSTSVRKNGRPAGRVMIVDDVPGVAEAIAHVLEGDGYETCAATDGYGALALATKIRPQAVVIDLGLPDMDGFELARRLREIGIEPRPVLIVASGTVCDDVVKKSADAGIDEYMVKPVDFVRLRDILATALSPA